MADQLRINGNMHSWGSIILKIDDQLYTGFTGITYAEKRERVDAYGMGVHQGPRGRSRGKYAAEPSKLTGWKASIQELREALAARASDGRSYGNVEFEVQIQYIEAITGNEIPIQVDLHKCTFVGNSGGDEEGPDPLKEEVEIKPLTLEINQLTLFDATEGMP